MLGRVSRRRLRAADAAPGRGIERRRRARRLRLVLVGVPLGRRRDVRGRREADRPLRVCGKSAARRGPGGRDADGYRELQSQAQRARARIEGVDVRDARGPGRARGGVGKSDVREDARGYLLLRKAALMGLASAWFDLSGLFLEGLVVEYDDRLSDFLLAYACAQKLPEARVETAESAFDVGDNELGAKLMAEAARDDYEAAVRLVLPRRLPEKAVALVLEYHDGIGLEEPPLVEVPIRTVDIDVGDESEMLRSALDALEASDAALDAMSSEDRPKAARRRGRGAPRHTGRRRR